MDQLLRLKGMEEHPLPAGEGGARRVGIQADRNYVVLLLDADNRLAGIDFFKTPDMKEKTAEYRYSDLSEVVPGAWVPFTHQARILSKEAPFTETVKVDSFVANQPVAETLFIASSFFDKNVDFVDDFKKIYPQEKGIE
jgi:hypothetical protein